MSKNTDLDSVGLRLEKAASSLLGKNPSASERYDTYEMLAIQILDSESQDFAPQQLEQYLTAYLEALREQI